MAQSPLWTVSSCGYIQKPTSTCGPYVVQRYHLEPTARKHSIAPFPAVRKLRTHCWETSMTEKIRKGAAPIVCCSCTLFGTSIRNRRELDGRRFKTPRPRLLRSKLERALAALITMLLGKVIKSDNGSAKNAKRRQRRIAAGQPAGHLLLVNRGNPFVDGHSAVTPLCTAGWTIVSGTVCIKH